MNLLFVIMGKIAEFNKAFIEKLLTVYKRNSVLSKEEHEAYQYFLTIGEGKENSNFVCSIFSDVIHGKFRLEFLRLYLLTYKKIASTDYSESLTLVLNKMLFPLYEEIKTYGNDVTAIYCTELQEGIYFREAVSNDIIALKKEIGAIPNIYDAIQYAHLKSTGKNTNTFLQTMKEKYKNNQLEEKQEEKQTAEKEKRYIEVKPGVFSLIPISEKKIEENVYRVKKGCDHISHLLDKYRTWEIPEKWEYVKKKLLDYQETDNPEISELRNFLFEEMVITKKEFASIIECMEKRIEALNKEISRLFNDKLIEVDTIIISEYMKEYIETGNQTVTLRNTLAKIDGVIEKCTRDIYFRPKEFHRLKKGVTDLLYRLDGINIKDLTAVHKELMKQKASGNPVTIGYIRMLVNMHVKESEKTEVEKLLYAAHLAREDYKVGYYDKYFSDEVNLGRDGQVISATADYILAYESGKDYGIELLRLSFMIAISVLNKLIDPQGRNHGRKIASILDSKDGINILQTGTIEKQSGFSPKIVQMRLGLLEDYNRLQIQLNTQNSYGTEIKNGTLKFNEYNHDKYKSWNETTSNKTISDGTDLLYEVATAVLEFTDALYSGKDLEGIEIAGCLRPDENFLQTPILVTRPAHTTINLKRMQQIVDKQNNGIDTLQAAVEKYAAETKTEEITVAQYIYRLLNQYVRKNKNGSEIEGSYIDIELLDESKIVSDGRVGNGNGVAYGPEHILKYYDEAQYIRLKKSDAPFIINDSAELDKWLEFADSTKLMKDSDSPKMKQFLMVMVKTGVGYAEAGKVLGLTEKTAENWHNVLQRRAYRIYDIESATLSSIEKYVEKKRAIIAESKKRVIVQYDLDGRPLAVWKSINEIANNTYTTGNGTVCKFNKGAISNVLNGRQKTANGFKWCYKYVTLSQKEQVEKLKNVQIPTEFVHVVSYGQEMTIGEFAEHLDEIMQSATRKNARENEIEALKHENSIPYTLIN